MNGNCQRYLRLIFWNPHISQRMFFLFYFGLTTILGIWNYKILIAVLLTQIFGEFGVIKWRLLGFGVMKSFLITSLIANITLLIYVWILVLAWKKWENSSLGEWIASKTQEPKGKFNKFFIFFKKFGPFGVFIAAITPFCTTIAIILVKILNKKYLIIVLIIANTIKIASFNWGFHFLFFK